MTNHGSRPLRGLESTQQSTIGTAKFGRMFRWLEPAQSPKNHNEQKELEAIFTLLAEEMVTTEFAGNVAKAGNPPPDSPLKQREPADENDTIPAGFTYFGQFIDHDITFDPASFLQQLNDPDATEDFRTPRLDLDCVYGRGPADQPYLYNKSTGRRTFNEGTAIGIAGKDRRDVPRLSADNTAIIGDKRNDENKIVTQIQALFLRLHNTVYAKIGARHQNNDTDDRFSQAQRITRWCYQWIVLNDYLPKICDEHVYLKIKPKTNDHKGPAFSHYGAHGEAYIPVEFAVAAFRFGHSMVRPSYSLNHTIQQGTGQFIDKDNVAHAFARIPIFVVKLNMQDVLATDALNGFGNPIPPNWGIDWGFFFGELLTHPDGTENQIPQPSYRIDTKLVDPLGDLPEFAAQHLEKLFVSLASRNLLRGVSMSLPSGQRIARMMGHEPLTDVQLWNVRFDGDESESWTKGAQLFNDNRKWLEGSAPLWFYILKEAELRDLPKDVSSTPAHHRKHFTHGRKLGLVGSTIVAETLYGLAWSDHFSFLFQEPNWDPSKENIPGLTSDMDMLALTTFVYP